MRPTSANERCGKPCPKRPERSLYRRIGDSLSDEKYKADYRNELDSLYRNIEHALQMEVNEHYSGATRPRGSAGAGKLKPGRTTLKQPVFGIFERDGRV